MTASASRAAVTDALTRTVSFSIASREPSPAADRGPTLQSDMANSLGRSTKKGRGRRGERGRSPPAPTDQLPRSRVGAGRRRPRPGRQDLLRPARLLYSQANTAPPTSPSKKAHTRPIRLPAGLMV
jgi:hypothetical protein